MFDIDTLSVNGMENLQLFFRRYDTNKDGRLSLAEFCKAFTPVGKEYASLVEGRAEFYGKKGMNPREFFNTDTRRYVRNLWQILLFTERQLDVVRQRLVKRPNFNARAAFKHADRDEDGAVTVSDLRETLAENAFYATDKEIALIMNKFDKFADMKITMTDFVEELQPRLF